MPRNSSIMRLACLCAGALLALPAARAQSGALHIAVVTGEDAVHSQGARVGKPITIEVTGAGGQPVEGARTSFQLPEEGPGGVFSNGLRTDLAVTDTQGRATVHGFQLNRIAGPFNVRVTAAKDQSRAGAVVRQRIGEPAVESGSANRKVLAPARPAAAEVAPANASTTAPPLTTPVAATPTPTVLQARAIAISPAPIAEPASRPGQVQTIVATQKGLRGGAGRSSSISHNSHKKWVLLGILAASGAAGAFAGQSMGTASAARNSGNGAGITSTITIGTPTITIGKP